MAEPDYYAVLGVDRKASPATIKAAYRALARRYHPDMNPGASAPDRRFQEAAHAYAILGDPARRAAYDGGRVLAQRIPPSTSAPAPAGYWASERPHPYWIADRSWRPQLGPGPDHRGRAVSTGPRTVAAPPPRAWLSLAVVALCIILALSFGTLCGVLFTAVRARG
jgi:hypothetical protein